MENLILWWDSFSYIQQIFLCVAIPATVILVLQTIFLLFGLGFGHEGDHGEDFGSADGDFNYDEPTISYTESIDTDGTDVIDSAYEVDSVDDLPDLDTDHDTDMHDGAHHVTGVRILTVRGMVAFFAVGGWSGVVALELNASVVLSAVIAVIAGLLALFLVGIVIRWALKLQEQGNINIANAVHKTGEVYLTIPASCTGKGKVNIVLQERYVELEAMTNESEPIKTGESVVVIGRLDQNVLLVEPINFRQPYPVKQN